MNALGQRIARLIEAQGPISIAQFMTLALHDPQGGYYATRDPFGARGDFVTAPEVSQMFGEMLGLWIAQSWHDQGKPDARLVELGPGRGTLMSDALRVIRQLMPEFLKRVEIVLVEASPTLTAIQKKALTDAGANVRWSVQFDGALADKPLFLLANEFFDALPVRQFVKTERGWCERMVVANDSVLDFALSPEAIPNAALPPSRDGAPPGAVYETSPAATAIVQQVAETIARRGGAALIVDYGYGAEAGFGETLQAVAAHKYASVLDAPGDADLSAHVDFAALAQTAREAGAAPFGPVPQGEFLEALGIVQRAATLARGKLGSVPEIDGQLERLILPDRMGALFKALAILPPGARPPAGF
ncbi:MAG: SAM-dependent methyltransferase [Proteobacteria bacterium]|nr:SAM-dependent methyltransferase [Pseudomonadota bacterium]